MMSEKQYIICTASLVGIRREVEVRLDEIFVLKAKNS